MRSRTISGLSALLVLPLLFSSISFSAAQGQAPLHQQHQQPFPLTSSSSSSSSTTTTRPNIVFIITDDQDLQLHSLDYQPLLQHHLLDHGTLYTHHYCTIAVCCPSRVSLLTGKAAHNTNVTDVNPPYGGYPKFVTQGLNDDYLPLWLQQAGYNTYYTGKLMNAHSVHNYDKPFPRGWNSSDFLLDPHTYQYLNSTWQRDRDPPVTLPGAYTTDILAENAHRLLSLALDDPNAPFFLTIAPVAPHANVDFSPSSGLPRFTAPIPADRHRHLFKHVRVPRTLNFNPSDASGASWVRDLPRQSADNVAYNDHFYRQRLRSLQAVDELVASVVRRLEQSGILENTYIFYTSDNGFHIGQHRLQPGKECGYEEDIRVPLVVRGPGVEKGRTVDAGWASSHTDLAPTFLKLAGVTGVGLALDGRAIPLEKGEIQEEGKGWRPEGGSRRRVKREHVNVEYWGWGLEEGDFGGKRHVNNTYKALRIAGQTWNLYYAVWCNGERELYDLNADPDQLHNLHPAASSLPAATATAAIRTVPLPDLLARLDALLFVLKSCRGAACVDPWMELHGRRRVDLVERVREAEEEEVGEEVGSLDQALDPRFDGWYERFAKRYGRVGFEWCAPGYIKQAEGAFWEDFRDGKVVVVGEEGFEL